MYKSVISTFFIITYHIVLLEPYDDPLRDILTFYKNQPPHPTLHLLISANFLHQNFNSPYYCKHM